MVGGKRLGKREEECCGWLGTCCCIVYTTYCNIMYCIRQVYILKPVSKMYQYHKTRYTCKSPTHHTPQSLTSPRLPAQTQPQKNPPPHPPPHPPECNTRHPPPSPAPPDGATVAGGLQGQTLQHVPVVTLLLLLLRFPAHGCCMWSRQCVALRGSAGHGGALLLEIEPSVLYGLFLWWWR